MTIARASWRDTWTLWQLMRACFGRDAYDLLSIFAILVWPGDITLKAISSERVVGFIAGSRPWKQDWAWVVALGVQPDFRRQAIASRLLAEYEAQATRSCVRLTVRAGNVEALALYHKMGYAEIERRAHYYGDGEDGLEMEKRLTAC